MPLHIRTSIAHAEQTPRENTGRLNGVQLWVATGKTVDASETWQRTKALG